MSRSDAMHEHDREAFHTSLCRACSAIGVSIKPDHLALMYAHFERLVETNRRFNLTRITAPADAAVKHYADSLTLLAAPWLDADQPLALLDVGTGAGFPAVPLAIMRPDWQITAIDGTGKKARFVAQAAAALGLANLRARHTRAADLARESPGTFDLVTLRAVDKIAAGLNEAHRLLRPGGAVVFYKTAHIEHAELTEGHDVARTIGLTPTAPFCVTLPSPDGDLARLLIRYER